MPYTRCSRGGVGLAAGGCGKKKGCGGKEKGVYGDPCPIYIYTYIKKMGGEGDGRWGGHEDSWMQGGDGRIRWVGLGWGREKGLKVGGRSGYALVYYHWYSLSPSRKPWTKSVP